mgnify:FL=1
MTKKTVTLEEAKEQLIELGKKSGNLTFDEVTEQLSEVEMEPEQFEQLLDDIEKEGIELDRDDAPAPEEK